MAPPGTVDKPVNFLGQSYQKLRKNAIKSKKPFIDPEFPASKASLFLKKKQKKVEAEWKRPYELINFPRLTVDGVSATDLIQGHMGNCWFITACSCLACHKDIFQKIVPNAKEQDWDTKNPQKHPGIFRFRFWRFGKWTEVVIDDLLPTKDGNLIFCHSPSKTEFWGALLEKAYAKLHGCYEALHSGELGEGLEDFTGGVAETIDVLKYYGKHEQEHKLFEILKKAWNNKALMSAAIIARSKNDVEQAVNMGLVLGHAYAITSVSRIRLAGSGLVSLLKKETLDMIRLRNPWGAKEWKGAFCDGSKEWEKVSKADQKKWGLNSENGEFWMTADDFCRYFVDLCICRIVNTKVFTASKTWNESLFHGGWKMPDRCGGCLNNPKTFFNNPQYMFEITKAEDELLLCLTQKSERGSTTKIGIGFTILKAECNRTYRMHSMTSVVKRSEFKNSRGVSLRETLKQGLYLVVVSTFDPGKRAEFLFRLYTDAVNNACELKNDSPKSKGGLFKGTPPAVVTRITVLKAFDLKKSSSRGSDAFVIVKCERKKFKSNIVTGTTEPEWNFSCLFYRMKPEKNSIKIQVLSQSVLSKEFLGEVEFKEFDKLRDAVFTMQLNGKNKGSGAGTLQIKVTSSRDLTAV